MPGIASFIDIESVQLAQLIRARELSAVEVMEAHLTHIGQIHPYLNAAVEVFEEEALAAAQAADRALAEGARVGPLHGVPFSVKDSIDVRGHRTTAGTTGLRTAPSATEDATLVARLRQAGGIPIAKTNLPDLLFAYESDNLLFGRTNNPYDVTRTAGGSSGGEAALLAACGSPLGLGSDAAGSVRIPAAFCGIAAIKPTSGRLPRTGHVPPPGGWMEALWQIGPMARYVEDLQLAMDILAGEDGRDYHAPPVDRARPKPLAELRLAFFTDNGFARCSDAIRTTVERAAEALGKAGAYIHHHTPPGVDGAYELELGLLGADGGDGIDAYLKQVGSDQQHWLLHAGFLGRIRSRRCSLSEFASLWTRWDQYRAAMAGFFRQYDAVLCPAYTDVALPHGQSAQPGNFEGFSYTMAWNVSGNPAAVVRCGESDGLPIAVQVVTPLWREAQALQICLALEQEFGGWAPPALLAAPAVSLNAG